MYRKRYNPYEHAEQLGIRVAHQELRAANGYWIPDHNLILLRSGMRAVHARTVLAHEIGHAVLGHRDDRPKHESQADRFAARNLIDLAECEAVMRATGDLYLASLELEVSQRMLRLFLELEAVAAA